MTALAARLSAALVAAIVTLGLVTATPNDHEVATLVTVSIADVQLQAAATATPQANATPSLQAVADVVKAVATAAFWYATLPLTLPSVVVTAAWKELSTNVLGGNPNFDIGGAILRAVVTYLTAPLDAIKQSVSKLFEPATPVAAQAQSGSSIEPTARQSAAPEQRSVASSRRTALAAIRAQAAPAAAKVRGAGSPSARRAAPDLDADTASTAAKQTATGGSGRGVKKIQAN